MYIYVYMCVYPYIYLRIHIHINLLFIYRYMNLKIPEVHISSSVAQLVKNLPAMWETSVRSLGWQDALEKEMATHSSILTWRSPWGCIVHGVAKSQT